MIDQNTLEEITHALITERLKWIEVILQSLKYDIPSEEKIETKRTVVQDQLLGLFADEPELIDEITESAMAARELDSLRII